MILILNAVTRENKIKPEKKLLDLVTHTQLMILIQAVSVKW